MGTLDLLELGYDVHIPVDCASSRSMTDRVFGLQRLRDSGAFLTTSEGLTLSKLNRILDTEHYALVVHNQRLYTSDRNIEEREVIVGIVTDIDLLQYIARHESGSSPSGSGSTSQETA